MNFRQAFWHHARGGLYFRAKAPGETQASVMNEVRRIISDDRVWVKAFGHSREPSESSSLDSVAWDTLDRTIREIFPRAVVTPYLVLGGTDSRYFRALAISRIRLRPATAP